LRPYWRNYFEKTDGLIWVVDSAGVWCRSVLERQTCMALFHRAESCSPMLVNMTTASGDRVLLGIAGIRTSLLGCCTVSTDMDGVFMTCHCNVTPRPCSVGGLREERLFGATLLIFANKQVKAWLS
jgi:hypothetical protein